MVITDNCVESVVIAPDKIRETVIQYISSRNVVKKVDKLSLDIENG